MSWPNAMSRGAQVLDRLSAGLRDKLERRITGDELDRIICDCNAATAAIFRDEALAREMQGQTRQALREGRASEC